MNDSLIRGSQEPSPSVSPDQASSTMDWSNKSNYLWLFFTFLVIMTSATKSLTKKKTKGTKRRLKTFVSGGFYLTLFVNISMKAQAYLSGHVTDIQDIAEPLVLTITMIIATSRHNSDVYTRKILHIFWFVAFIKNSLKICTEVYNGFQKSEADTKEFIASITFYVALVFQTFSSISSLLEDDDSKDEESDKKTMEEKASFLSKITFSWMNGLLKLGYRKTLENDDLSDLQSDRTAQNAFEHFHPYWEREFQKFRRTTGTQSEKEEKKAKSGKLEASVFRAILLAFYASIMYTIFLELIQKVFDFVYPQVLKHMIKTIEDENQALWKGAMFAIAMFVMNMTRTLIGNQLGHHNIHFEYKLKASLMSTIYSKMLKVSHAARKSSTVGEIVNLMSVDCGRFVTMVHWIHNIWLAPLQAILSMYFLWLEVGVGAVAGFVAILLFLPLHNTLGKRTRNMHVKLAETKDSRIKLMNEVLNGIKVLKLYTWEKPFEKKILEIREKEMSLMQKIKIYDSFSTLIWHIGPFLVSLSSFGLYVLTDDANILTAEKAFVCISIFHILSWSVSAIPHTLNGIVMGFVSLKRINKFLNSEELDEDVIKRSKEHASAISVKDASFSWDKEEDPILKGMNFEIPQGSLVAIVGSVGSGKSSLLSAILGEMDKKSGNVNVKGSTAYVSQQAWIQNGTLRDNILFGCPHDKELYRSVIDGCALRDDLAILPGGNMAEIGEKGINLSGGQKQRVNMARAVYQDADIYLFDDPLSAVDSHVGKHIFKYVIGPSGVLQNKTRILVTHGISFLPQMDKIITLVNGEISEVGTYEELKSHNGAFSEFLKTYMKEESSGSSSDDSEDEDGNKNDEPSKGGRKHNLMRGISKDFKPYVEDEDAEKSKDIGEETVESGEMKFSVYTSYISKMGNMVVFLTFLTVIAYRASEMLSSFWLTEWTTDIAMSASGQTSVNISNSNQCSSSEDTKYYRVGIYGLFGLLRASMAFADALLHFLGGLTASRFLHQKLLRNVLSSPMSFFDTNPVGRIVTRFSKDIDVIDWFSHGLKGYAECVTKLITIPLLVGYNLPWFLVSLLPITLIFLALQKFHNPTTRQLKRLEAANKSPIYTHFSESINGVSTIRAYQQQERFETESRKRIDKYHKSLFSLINVHRWVGIRVEVLAVLVDLCAALFAVLSRDVLTAGVVALCITYTMDTTHTMNWFMHVTLNTDEDLVSVERINEYSEKPTEAPWEIEKTKPSESWPQTGNVSFKNYQVRYRDDLDLVLKGISCDIKEGEKVGIVGRTGAGKSSLTMALFRIIESAEGSIVIDDVDISTIGLHDLRSKLTIIPQDPVIFSGTLRMNLDPFEQYTDEEIWRALEHAHLGKFIKSLPKKLQHECSEGGDNLSVGQRQLICLARALLKKTKVLILDEATAAVDMATDDLIQKTIRTEFADCTVLTIAHRLNTIMDYSRIMVLSKGKIEEFDTPKNLLSDSSSIFYSMAHDANLV